MQATSNIAQDRTPKKQNQPNLIDKLKHPKHLVNLNSARKASLCSDTETASVDSSGFLEPQFAHSQQKYDLLSMTVSQLSGNSDNRQGACMSKKPSDKYKTELCKNFVYHGFCKWGDNCFFAHGKHELKSKVVLSQFYKTKVCKHFHKGGFCPYGSRCQYFHFKPFEINRELCDSYIKKLILKIEQPRSRLESILNANERVQKRLSVFQSLCKGDGQKSLQERFLDDEF